MYRTLMQCVAATLTEFAANPRWLGATGAFTLVLHTWTQDLRRHIHVHALMACGGLDAPGPATTPPACTSQSIDGPTGTFTRRSALAQRDA